MFASLLSLRKRIVDKLWPPTPTPQRREPLVGTPLDDPESGPRPLDIDSQLKWGKRDRPGDRLR
jgi:hypothetical protein